MYKEVPLLEFTTFTRIVRILWSRYDVQNSVVIYFLKSGQTVEEWNKIEESVALKIENSLLPILMKITLSKLVKPIGSRIKHIVKQIYDNGYFPNHFMSILHWTSIGTIDAKKTADAAIKDVNLPVTKRYEIACTYCLEEEISILWNKLSEVNRITYLNVPGPIFALRYFPMYWAYYMNLEMDSLKRKIREEYCSVTSPCQFGLLFASITANQPAVEYFIGKISTEEKERFLTTFFRSLEYKLGLNKSCSNKVYSCDIIYFLLLQMSENQRSSIFQKYAYNILHHFLEFPYQGFFLEFESNVRQYLTDNQTEALLERIRLDDSFCYRLFRTFKIK